MRFIAGAEERERGAEEQRNEANEEKEEKEEKVEKVEKKALERYVYDKNARIANVVQYIDDKGQGWIDRVRSDEEKLLEPQKKPHNDYFFVHAWIFSTVPRCEHEQQRAHYILSVGDLVIFNPHSDGKGYRATDITHWNRVKQKWEEIQVNVTCSVCEVYAKRK